MEKVGYIMEKVGYIMESIENQLNILLFHFVTLCSRVHFFEYNSLKLGEKIVSKFTGYS